MIYKHLLYDIMCEFKKLPNLQDWRISLHSNPYDPRDMRNWYCCSVWYLPLTTHLSIQEGTGQNIGWICNDYGYYQRRITPITNPNYIKDTCNYIIDRSINFKIDIFSVCSEFNAERRKHFSDTPKDIKRHKIILTKLYCKHNNTINKKHLYNCLQKEYEDFKQYYAKYSRPGQSII